MKAMISVRNVRKVWNPDTPKALTAIDGLSFDVAPGEFVVLLWSFWSDGKNAVCSTWWQA